jgi:putative ABC transport system permease protein
VTAEMRMLDPKYRDSSNVLRVQRELVERVRAIPGVSDVGLTSAVPFRGTDFYMVFGDQKTGPKPANGRYVDAGYFSVLRVPVVRGRLFTAEDRLGSPRVAVISESFARKFFDGEDPIGKPVSFGEQQVVVGVVADTRYVGMDKDPVPAVYMPVGQAPSTLLCVVLRTNASMAAVAPAIRRAVHEIDPTLPAMNITTIDRIVDQSVANRRFYTLATAAFATIALVLTIVGLVVVVTRVVAERRRELAIRSALGATMTRLAVGATASVMVAVCAGVVIGCAGAYAGAMGMTQFLFQVAPRSPLVYGVVAVLITGVAFVAAGAPVRRFGTLSLSMLLKAD